MKDIESKIDDIVSLMALSMPKRGSGQVIKSLDYFRRAEPFSEPGILSELHSGDIGYFSDAELEDVNHRVDVSAMVTLLPDNEGEEPDPDVSILNRVRLVKAKDLRGKLAHFMPFIFENTGAIISKSKFSYESFREYMGYDGKRWRVCGPFEHMHLGKVIPEVFVKGGDNSPARCRLAIGIEFTRNMVWSVEMGYVGCPTISLATDQTGARAVFRLRDIPEGRKRRTAIKHWVREHWRQKRDGGETGVKAHLRGAERFTWNDLVVVIRPSKDDLKKAKEARSPKR